MVRAARFGVTAWRAPGARARLLLLLGWLAVMIIALGLYSLRIGSPVVGFGELWQIAFEGGGGRLARIVVLQLRLPRLALALLVGALLALAGVLLQEGLRNPIAGPELLGVSSGASVVVATITIFQLPVAFVVIPWLALLGGCASGAVVVAVAHRLNDPVRLALVGAAMSAIFGAMVIALISLGTQGEIGQLFFFLLGSFANRTWAHVRLVLPWALVGIPLALLSARTLNILRLGDEVAAGLGLAVARTRLLLTLLAGALVAATVAVCGPVAFVALLAPHLARRLLGATDTRQILPLAGLLGAALLLAADVAGRRVFAPQEFPVGMWTTLVGVPLLLVLLRGRLGKG